MATSQQYNLAPAANIQVTLTLGTGEMTVAGSASPVTQITVGTVGGKSGQATQFVISNQGSEYAEGYIVVTYQGANDQNQTCECHLNFLLATTSWAQDDSGAFPNDNTTVLPKASTTGTLPTNIPVTQPSSSGGSGIDSLYQVLDEAMVFMVDYYPGNKTYLFRGNTPFDAPATTNGPQSVDFKTLYTYMKARYQEETGDQTGFPEYGAYVLRDVCLQSPASEGDSMLCELASFGGDTLNQLANEVWYPAVVPGPQNQMCNWAIEPVSADDQYDFQAAEKLSTYMNQLETIHHIYYIHCASGHDRTGIVASSYLIINRGFSLEKALICGTTVAKLSGGSDPLMQDCIDIDGSNKEQTDPDRSRILMIASVYNQTVMDIYNSQNPSNPAATIPPKAVSTNPAYVYSEYPWESIN